MAGLTLGQLWACNCLCVSRTELPHYAFVSSGKQFPECAFVSVLKEWDNWCTLQRASLMADLEHGIMQAGVLEGDQGCLGYPHGDAPQIQGLAGEHQLALREQGL